MSILYTKHVCFSYKHNYFVDFSSNLSLFNNEFSKFAPKFNKLNDGEFESTKSGTC